MNSETDSPPVDLSVSASNSNYFFHILKKDVTNSKVCMLREHFQRCLIFIISSSNVVFLKHASSKLVYIARSKYEVAQSSGGSVSL